MSPAIFRVINLLIFAAGFALGINHPSNQDDLVEVQRERIELLERRLFLLGDE